MTETFGLLLVRHTYTIKIHVQFVYAFLAKALFFYKWS